MNGKTDNINNKSDALDLLDDITRSLDHSETSAATTAASVAVAVAAWIDRYQPDFVAQVERALNSQWHPCFDSRTLASLGEELSDIAAVVAERLLAHPEYLPTDPTRKLSTGLLRTMAANIVRDKLRRHRLELISLDTLQTDDYGAVRDTLADPDAIVDGDLNRAQKSPIQAALQQVLSANLAPVVWLKVYGGYSTDEIATQLAIEPETARKRYTRAIDTLRRKAESGELPSVLLGN